MKILYRLKDYNNEENKKIMLVMIKRGEQFSWTSHQYVANMSVASSCPTSICALMLYKYTGNGDFLIAMRELNEFYDSEIVDTF